MDTNTLHLFQPEDEEGMKYHMLKIRQTMEIAPETAYCVWTNNHIYPSRFIENIRKYKYFPIQNEQLQERRLYMDFHLLFHNSIHYWQSRGPS